MVPPCSRLGLGTNWKSLLPSHYENNKGMSELSELYQETILEHNKNPRNFRELEDADRSADGNNPWCGGALRVYVDLEGDVVKDVAFKGSGCAISKASASMMTQTVKGKTREEA